MKFIVQLIGDNNSRFEIVRAENSSDALYVAKDQYPEFHVSNEIFIEVEGLKNWFFERGMFL